MFKLPVSDYVADYYKKRGIEFTYRQQARLCWTGASLLKEQLELLRELLALSDDTDLNAEIRERITFEEESLKYFMTNNNPAIIYILTPISDDDDDPEPEYFSQAENAIAYGKAIGEAFSLEKRYLQDCRSEKHAEEKMSDEVEDSLGTYFFTQAGEVRYGWSQECNPTFDVENTERFEWMFLNIESPFGLGDIVMGTDWEYPRVVSTDHNCYKEQYERFKDRSDIRLDSSDNCIRTDYVHIDGSLYYEHTVPFKLWKIDSWEDKEYWEILQRLSMLVNAGISVDDFMYLVHRYAEREKNEHE